MEKKNIVFVDKPEGNEEPARPRHKHKAVTKINFKEIGGGGGLDSSG